MFTVRQLIQERGEEETYSVSPQTNVFDALKVMADKNVGAVMIVENGQMIGIFTERDYARKVILKGKCSLDTPIKDIMTREMITIHPEHSLEDCINLMTRFHIRHLPIMDEGHLVGMISMRDVMEAVISKKDRTIENLENYILGEGYGK